MHFSSLKFLLLVWSSSLLSLFDFPSFLPLLLFSSCVSFLLSFLPSGFSSSVLFLFVSFLIVLSFLPFRASFLFLISFFSFLPCVLSFFLHSLSSFSTYFLSHVFPSLLTSFPPCPPYLSSTLLSFSLHPTFYLFLSFLPVSNSLCFLLFFISFLWTFLLFQYFGFCCDILIRPNHMEILTVQFKSI